MSTGIGGLIVAQMIMEDVNASGIGEAHGGRSDGSRRRLAAVGRPGVADVPSDRSMAPASPRFRAVSSGVRPDPGAPPAPGRRTPSRPHIGGELAADDEMPNRAKCSQTRYRSRSSNSRACRFFRGSTACGSSMIVTWPSQTRMLYGERSPWITFR